MFFLCQDFLHTAFQVCCYELVMFNYSDDIIHSCGRKITVIEDLKQSIAFWGKVKPYTAGYPSPLVPETDTRIRSPKQIPEQDPRNGSPNKIPETDIRTCTRTQEKRLKKDANKGLNTHDIILQTCSSSETHFFRCTL